MNELKVFENPTFGQVRTIEIDNEPWFVGKDVAEALGYRDTSDALKKHVDADDKLTRRFADSGQAREMYIINESGLYSLILSSKMPKAKAFKHWVTSEVLPAIRKNGVYETVKAQQHIEQLEATNERLTAAIHAVSTAKEQLAEVTDLRNDFIKHRDDYKARFIQAKANYGKICDSLRQAEGLVAKAQAELDSRIDQLQIIAFGLPGFDQIMADIFTTEKKE